jgi:DNA-binding CsgD family transcriptional regulator
VAGFAKMLLQNAETKVQDLIARIDYLHELDDIQSFLPEIADLFGAEHATFSIRNSTVPDDPKMRRFQTFSESLIDDYMAMRAYEFDPAANHLRNGVVAACLSELDWTDPRSQTLRKQFAAKNLGPSGLAMAVYGPCRLVGLISIFSSSEVAPWFGWKMEAKSMVGLVLTHMFSIARQLVLTDEFSADTLSKREKECLEWSARGKTIKETAMILGLAEASVRHILDDARLKLGAATKSQAVARAQELRLLNA